MKSFCDYIEFTFLGSSFFPQHRNQLFIYNASPLLVETELSQSALVFVTLDDFIEV